MEYFENNFTPNSLWHLLTHGRSGATGTPPKLGWNRGGVRSIKTPQYLRKFLPVSCNFSSLQNLQRHRYTLSVGFFGVRTMYNGEVGNFVMVKTWSLLFYISNDDVTLTECFYKLNSFFTARCTTVQSAVLRSHVVCLSVCDVGGSGPHRSEILETNCTDN